MMESLFIINSNGDVVIEKHWREATSRLVCDFFVSEVSKAESPEEVLPIIVTPKYYLIHILVDGMFYVGIVKSETQPLLIIEFLYRVVDIFNEYFDNDISEENLKDNFSTIYQLLDEMMDYGFPFTTEPNVLKEMILPPSFFGRWMNAVTGNSSVSESLPSGTLSNIPWRKSGVKYASNEIYVDLVEEIDCIVGSNNMQVSAEVSGEVMVNCKLSAMPDLLLVFQNPKLLDDCSFHPCVRYNKFEQEKVLSFVPPDGNFKLMDYRVTQSTVSLPIFVRPIIVFSNDSRGGKIEITVGYKDIKFNKKKNKGLEDVAITVPFPKVVSSVNASVSHGSILFDEKSKLLTWNIGKVKDKSPILSGTIPLVANAEIPESTPSVSVYFKLASYCASGLKIAKLEVTNQTYSTFKGVRSVTMAGNYQVRTA